MIKAVCIDKNGERYKLLDTQNMIADVTSEQLKNAIKNKQIDVINLRLTKDGKLVEKYMTKIDEDKLVCINAQLIKNYVQPMCKNKDIYFKSNANINNVAVKASTVGASFMQIENNLYIIVDNKKLGIISDKQIGLPWSCINLFENTSFRSINFKNVCTFNVRTIESMFSGCIANKIDMSDFDASRVTNMRECFKHCKVNKIILDNIDTYNVANMRSMFNECTVKELDLSSFNTSNVTDMSSMFYGCRLKELDLSNFDTSRVKNMNSMFSHSSFEKLDVSKFNTQSLEHAAGMFSYCNISSRLDIRNFKIQLVSSYNIAEMFYGFKCPEIDIRGTELDSIDINERNKRYIKSTIELFENCYSKIIR